MSDIQVSESSIDCPCCGRESDVVIRSWTGETGIEFGSNYTVCVSQDEDSSGEIAVVHRIEEPADRITCTDE
jgi:hypothetical protein